MSTDSQAPASTPWSLAPRRGATLRTLLETGLGCAILMLFARLFRGSGSGVGAIVGDLPLFLSLVWLTAWPAWRLRPIERRRWWARIGLGFLRAVAVGLVLAIIGTGLSLALLGNHPAGNVMASIFFSYIVLRAVVTVGAVLARRVRRRVRWQLVVSHVGIIVLMFVILTSGASVMGLFVATHYVPSHPSEMAASVSDDLRLAGAVLPVDGQRTNEVFGLIYARRLLLRGGSPLVAFASAPLLPNAVGVVTPDGRVLQGRIMLGQDGKRTRVASSLADLTHLSPARWEALRRTALEGRTGQERLGGNNLSESVVVEPIRGGHGVVTALLVLRVIDFQPTQQQFFRILLTIFGLTTIALILITSIPMLGLSFLFSYLLARGLTRRLESLSGVATSIASGNLDQRVPVTAGNEVGRLAEDVNRMADHLQTTMGELQAARAQSDEALRLRQELVANISHELRTPLATMRAHLETVTMRDWLTAGVAPAGGGGDVPVPAPTLQVLQAETERLEALVDDLFALSRAQAGAIEMRLEAVDVADLVEEIAASMQPLAQREGRIALSAEILHRPLWARADRSRLQQILANLIRNAVRYTPDGGIIVMSVSRQAEWILVTVADTGEGISAEQLPEIFDRFYRADPARSRATGGAGLGLAIVREFVELMGGRVEVESVVGEGTRFHVSLPSA
jgi:signal transduction histidine kinase